MGRGDEYSSCSSASPRWLPSPDDSPGDVCVRLASPLTFPHSRFTYTFPLRMKLNYKTYTSSALRNPSVPHTSQRLLFLLKKQCKISDSQSECSSECACQGTAKLHLQLTCRNCTQFLGNIPDLPMSSPLIQSSSTGSSSVITSPAWRKTGVRNHYWFLQGISTERSLPGAA